MKKRLPLLALACLFGGFFAVKSQVKTVTLDTEMMSFGGNTPLPAQSHFQVKGTTEAYISKIALEIYDHDPFGTPDYKSDWVRTYGYTQNAFTIPVYYLLRNNADYSFRIKRFRKLNDTEKDELRKVVYQALDDYVDAQLRVQNRRLYFAKPPKTTITDMNTVVNTGFRYFENARGEFAGFSDLIKDRIKQMETLKVKKNTLMDMKRDTVTKPDAEMVQREVAGLKSLVRNELNYFLNEDIYRLVEDREIRDYPVEKLPNVIGVNVGYAAVFLGGTLQNPEYGSAPYVGVSLPLGNSRFAPFMSKMSVSTGIFLTDVKDQNDRKYTGAYISKPIYLGLGYKVFDFVRINAGAVMLDKDTNPNNTGLRTSDVRIQPFVGISADFSLWLGVGTKQKR